ncbi:MAG: type IV pilus twitching motility protein PilT [Planctomycetota bacterium]
MEPQTRSPEDLRLGRLVLECGLIAEADLERCLEIQALTGGTLPLGRILIEQGLITKANLDQFLALQKTRVESRRAISADGAVDLVERAFRENANELVVSEGRQVMARIAGAWVAMSEEPWSGPQVWDFVRENMGSDILEELADTCFVSREFSRRNLCRGRITAFRQFDGVAVTIRMHPLEARTPEDQGIPQGVVDLVAEGKGMILVAGERGSGRTETLASLLREVARDPERFALVLDDSLEYPLPEGPALVARRHVGSSIHGYGAALRLAIREDPDAILVGEIGEPDSFDLAVRAAEAGRLVIGCLHAGSVVAALKKVTAFYPSYDVSRVRATLASVLRAVVSSHLLPDTSGRGLVSATEVLIVDEAAREVIRNGVLGHLMLLMRMRQGSDKGHCLDNSLLELLARGRVSAADAFARAQSKTRVLEFARSPASGNARTE